jgi:calcium permeable stress-gated cation channel
LQIIYEPKVKYHEDNKKPPKMSSGLFGWVSPLIHTKEQEIINKAGLDAATFLRFLRMFRWCFSALALFSCAVLIPVDVVYNIKASTSHNNLNMLTIQFVSGSYLYVHIVAEYVITAIALIFVWIHWGHMVRLRQQWFRSAEHQQAFYARTLLITSVPRKLQSDEGIAEVFRSMSMPYPTTSQHIGRKVGRLPDLIQYHNDTVREFEQILVGYLKGGRIGKDRPMLRQGGFLGMGGKKRDAIDFYTYVTHQFHEFYCACPDHLQCQIAAHRCGYRGLP